MDFQPGKCDICFRKANVAKRQDGLQACQHTYCIDGVLVNGFNRENQRLCECERARCFIYHFQRANGDKMLVRQLMCETCRIKKYQLSTGILSSRKRKRTKEDKLPEKNSQAVTDLLEKLMGENESLLIELSKSKNTIRNLQDIIINIRLAHIELSVSTQQ